MLDGPKGPYGAMGPQGPMGRVRPMGRMGPSGRPPAAGAGRLAGGLPFFCFILYGGGPDLSGHFHIQPKLLCVCIIGELGGPSGLKNIHEILTEALPLSPADSETFDLSDLPMVMSQF